VVGNDKAKDGAKKLGSRGRGSGVGRETRGKEYPRQVVGAAGRVKVDRDETEDRGSEYGEVLFEQVGIVMASQWVDSKDDLDVAAGISLNGDFASLPCPRRRSKLLQNRSEVTPTHMSPAEALRR
jgi:hypothetical protein